MGKMFFYAVAVGRVPGVYDTWDECEDQVKKYTGAKFRKFASRHEAFAYAGVQASTRATVAAASAKPTSTKTLVAQASNASTTAAVVAAAAAKPPSTKALVAQTIGSSSKSTLPSPSKQVQTAEKSRVSKFVPSLSTVDDNAEFDPRYVEIIYSDGACKGNGKDGSIAGVGVWYADNDHRNIAERLPGKQTNNRAELLAIIRVLEELPEDGKRTVIRTDSRYCMDCVSTWLTNWIRNDWISSSKKEVSNKELIRYLVSLLELRHVIHQTVQLQHVKGHSGIEGNEGADRQANLGAALPEISDEPDWDAKRRAVEERIDAHIEEKKPAVMMDSKKTTAVSSQFPAVNALSPPRSSQAYVAELTEDDIYDVDDILDPAELEAELNS